MIYKPSKFWILISYLNESLSESAIDDKPDELGGLVLTFSYVTMLVGCVGWTPYTISL